MKLEFRTKDDWHKFSKQKIDDGDFISASSILKRALIEHPDDINLKYQLGHSYVYQGRLQDALACINELLEINPEEAKFLAKKGSILKYLNHVNDGRKLCVLALEQEPDSDDVLYTIAEAFLNESDELGIALVNRLLKKNPDHFDAIYLQGLWYWFKDEPTNAKKCFVKAVGLSKNLINRLYSQVFFTKTMTSPKKALMFLEQCVSFDVKNPKFFTVKGELLLDLGENEKALKSYEEAKRISSNIPNPDIYYGLGCIHFYNGDHQRAEEYLFKTLEYNPSHAQALTNLAAIYCDVHSDYNKALELVNTALECDDNLVTAKVNKGIILGHIGDFSNAIISFDEALALDPDNSLALLRKGGLINDKLRLHDEAIKLFNRAAKIDPNNAICWWNLSQAYIKKNDFDQAIIYLKKVVEIEPNYADAFVNMGILYMKMGRNEDARQAFKSLFLINPMDPRALQGLEMIPEDDDKNHVQEKEVGSQKRSVKWLKRMFHRKQ